MSPFDNCPDPSALVYCLDCGLQGPLAAVSLWFVERRLQCVDCRGELAPYEPWEVLAVVADEPVVIQDRSR